MILRRRALSQPSVQGRPKLSDNQAPTSSRCIGIAVDMPVHPVQESL